MQKSVSVAKNNLCRTLFEARFYFALFVNTILIKQLTDTINKFSESVDIKVCPWIFPFLMQEKYIQFLFLAGAVLLFCDAPFVDGGSSYEIIRAGKKNWIVGKIIYMFSLSVIYTSGIVLITILLLIPHVTFQNSWGKVLGTLAQTNAAAVFGNAYIELDYGIMLKYHPVTAMLFSYILSFCVCFIVGLCVLVMNLYFKKIPGALGGMAIALMSYFQNNFSDLYIMSYVSPTSWLDIALWNREVTLSYPSVNYMITFLSMTIIVLSGITVVMFGNSEDILKKKGEG